MIIRFLKPLFRKEEAAEKDSVSFYNDLAVDVLARTIWGEARAESPEGMEAVACVVLNRVKVAQARGGKYWWGNDIISVCQKPYQFSCWNRSDPNYRKLVDVSARDKKFVTCQRIARRAVAGALQDKTGGATHYHADYITPFWAEGETPTIIIGRHIFYKLVEG